MRGSIKIDGHCPVTSGNNMLDSKGLCRLIDVDTGKKSQYGAHICFGRKTERAALLKTIVGICLRHRKRDLSVSMCHVRRRKS